MWGWWVSARGVESYRVEGGLGEALGAVEDGGWADESGEGADTACGALVEGGGVAGEGTGSVVGEVEMGFGVGDDVAERVAGAVAGG